MAAFFQAQALPARYRSLAVEGVKLARVEFGPGTPASILYAITFAGRAEEPLLATLTFAGERLADPAALGSLQLEFFPDDAALPSLAFAADAAASARALAAALGAPNGSAVRVRSVQVLRYRPHAQCVLRYAVELPGGRTKTVIGKVYADANEAAQAEERLRIMAGLSGPSVPAVPEPIALVVEWNLVLMAEVRGVRLKDAIANAAAQADEAVATVATGLAALHGAQLAIGETQTPAGAIELLRWRASIMRPLAPGLAARFEALVRQAGELVGGLSTAPRGVIHGDCGLNHLYVDGDRLAIIDLDTMGVGDPAADLGDLMAAMTRRAEVKGQKDLGRLAEELLTQYQARSPAADLERRVRTYQSLALLRMAARRFERAPYLAMRKGSASVPAQLFEAAASCLNDL